ncbi:FAD-dependent oxidoreductase [Sphingorhabdus sp.]|jgi:3-oxosteroid 1-dehydrogenase|uniref:FAD-dependent oxidoreductase n=1 Tax=Sphingorhabdus sp. TaxID=1902408 RepID=UPI0037C7B196
MTANIDDDLADIASFDVIVCGSGAAGLLAAIRLADKGLKPVVIEKSGRFGGTSAISGGGIWVPAHGLTEDGDSYEQGMTYLRAESKGDVREEKLAAYLAAGSETVSYLGEIGVAMTASPAIPDYIDAPGSRSGRSLFPLAIDGSQLGEDFFRLREAPETYRLFGRIAMNLDEGLVLAMRKRGWIGTVVRLLARYWSDLGWRRKTPVDRRLTGGRALIGSLRLAMKKRQIPIWFDTSLCRIRHHGDRVVAIDVKRHGNIVTLETPKGLVLAAGGYEQNQALRDRHLPVATDRGWSLTPPGMNNGVSIELTDELGAATEHLGAFWWAPSILLPSKKIANLIAAEAMYFDNRHPFSLCVNRLGKRFVNESCSYDRFGQAMIADQLVTGANLPCWMIFDWKFRCRFSCGPILPHSLLPDRRLPPEWWDSYIFKAEDLRSLGRKIGVPSETLMATVERLNGFAAVGQDEDFGRGNAAFDRYFGKPNVKPNPCLGPLDTGPYYAVKIELGDLGTKGGLKTDSVARVMKKDGTVFDNLYAVGNSAGSPFGNCYPGAGGTLGPALVFARLAADDLGSRAG